MVKIKFIEDKNAPYGFSIEPIDKSNYKKTTYKMHLDTKYVRMSLWMDSMCISYLFDKNKNYISWKQREKEIGGKERTKELVDGYKVVRQRKINFSKDDYYENGVEYFLDTLYHKNRYQLAKRYYEITPMQSIYEEMIASNKDRQLCIDTRKANEKKYLDPKTSKEERIKILDEEVGYLVGIYAYHFMVRDTDKLVNLPNYDEYEKLYFSKIDNKKEYYIEYLKAYCRALRDCAIDDIEGEKEMEFIKNKCQEANLLDVFL